MQKDYYVANVQIVVQADDKHTAAEKIGQLLNPMADVLDWGPKDYQDGNEMDYIGKIDPEKYKEGDFTKLISV